MAFNTKGNQVNIPELVSIEKEIVKSRPTWLRAFRYPRRFSIFFNSNESRFTRFLRHLLTKLIREKGPCVLIQRYTVYCGSTSEFTLEKLSGRLCS